VIVLFVTPIGTEAPAVAAAIQRGGAGATKTGVTCVHGHARRAGGAVVAARGPLPVVCVPRGRGDRAGARGALRPLAGAPPARCPSSPSTRRAARAAIGDRHGWLRARRDPRRARGLRHRAAEHAARGAAEAAATAASAVGYPVAIKLASATITHKTDVGGVILDVADAAAARQAFADIDARLAAIGRAAEMDGVTLQPMVPRGVELFVGATRTPGFGPLIGFGIGGVAVELWKDIGFRVAPAHRRRRHRADRRGPRAQALLDGFRGGPVADRPALRDAILRIDRLMGDLDAVLELDLNPIVTRGPGQGVIAIDARIRVA
jgi:hypothetical protein